MFQLLCGGPWFDRQAVMADDSIERLQQEFDKCVRRPEIKITKIFSKGEWRPNIRLANRFCSGRVFIAGGNFEPFRHFTFFPISLTECYSPQMQLIRTLLPVDRA